MCRAFFGYMPDYTSKRKANQATKGMRRRWKDRGRNEIDEMAGCVHSHFGTIFTNFRCNLVCVYGEVGMVGIFGIVLHQWHNEGFPTD